MWTGIRSCVTVTNLGECTKILVSGENGTIFHTVYWEDRKVNKSWISFLTPRYELWMNYVADASNEKMLLKLKHLQTLQK